LHEADLLFEQLGLSLLIQNDLMELGHLPLEVREEQLQVGKAVG
jgi:hypothetical protein